MFSHFHDLTKGGAFERYFCPGERNFKSFNAKGGGGGLLKFRIDRYIVNSVLIIRSTK